MTYYLYLTYNTNNNPVVNSVRMQLTTLRAINIRIYFIH